MSAVTGADVIARLPSLLAEAKMRAVVISDGETDLGVIVSMKDYEIVRRAKAEQFLKAMREFGEDVRTRAAKDGITVDELEKMFNRKAS